MAAGQNPLASLAAMLSGGQGGASAQQPDSGQQLAAQMSQMRQANPQMVLEQLKQMKTLTAALIPHLADTIPGAAQHLARNLSGIEGAMQAVMKALTAQSLSQGPLMMSAAQPADPTAQSGGIY